MSRSSLKWSPATGRRKCRPRARAKSLNAKEVALVKAWIANGAKADDEAIPEDPKKHWAYQPPKRPMLTGNSIDFFLDAERGKRNLSTNPPADRADTPSPRLPRPDRHAADAGRAARLCRMTHRPNAYEKVVDRLLASPQYGERWGRHWMDVWRYSDWYGFGEEYPRQPAAHLALARLDHRVAQRRQGLRPHDRRDAGRRRARAGRSRHAARHRLPRPQLVQVQPQRLAAGHGRAHGARRFSASRCSCARCHDHKYDPISQQEYYRFRAFFEPHDVRIDRVPGQPDTNKDGLARVFDAKPRRADVPVRPRRRAEPGQVASRCTPACRRSWATTRLFGRDKFTTKDFAETLPAASPRRERVALSELQCARGGTRSGELRPWRSRCGKPRKLPLGNAAEGARNSKPFLHDMFAKKDDERWKVVSGNGHGMSGKLICKTASTFATVSAKKDHPQSLMGRIRYKTTGGGIGSVGFSYDVADNELPGRLHQREQGLRRPAVPSRQGRGHLSSRRRRAASGEGQRRGDVRFRRARQPAEHLGERQAVQRLSPADRA